MRRLSEPLASVFLFFHFNLDHEPSNTRLSVSHTDVYISQPMLFFLMCMFVFKLHSHKTRPTENWKFFLFSTSTKMLDMLRQFGSKLLNRLGNEPPLIFLPSSWKLIWLISKQRKLNVGNWNRRVLCKFFLVCERMKSWMLWDDCGGLISADFMTLELKNTWKDQN